MVAIVRRSLTACVLTVLFAVTFAPSVAAQDAAKPLWSGRFDVEPDKALLAWGASFCFDRRLFEDDVTGAWRGRKRWRAPACSPHRTPTPSAVD